MGFLTASKTARPPGPPVSEPPGTLERRAIARLLEAWAEYGLSLGESTRGTKRWADGWKAALLGQGPAPAEDDLEVEAAVAAAFDNAPDLAAFVTSIVHRRRTETRAVASVLSGLATAFLELILETREGLLEDARDDEEIGRSIAHLEAAVSADDDHALRLRAEQVLRVVHRKSDARRKRSEARMKTLGAKLAEQRDALVDPDRKKGTDAMTGLPSRHALEGVLERERLIAQLSRVPASVAKLCIPSKAAASNRDAMDRLMALVAARLAPTIDRRFFFGRFSGDHFLVVMPGLDEVAAAEQASAWVKAVVGRPLEVSGRSFKAPFFGGVAECLPEERRDEWVSRADEAMEAAEAQTQRRALRYSEL